jgi:voltage-gated potassium channel Kch
MSRGVVSSVILLAIVSFIIVLLISSVIIVLNIKPLGESEVGFAETIWMSLMRTLDPGTMGDDDGWSFRLFMLLITTYGIIMLSTFIGLISNGIMTKLTELRKGRSRVIESGHTLILGWSPKIFTIISELVIANENQKNAKIVILADMDKVEMEDEVRSQIASTKNTRIIFRSGNPIDVNDLEIANPKEAKSIIALGSASENSDAEIIKCILAVTKSLESVKRQCNIVAEIENVKNLEVAKMIGKDNVELILSDEFISRILVQTSRQAGLSIVYTDLLDFDGDEIYFSSEPKLNGRTFKEAMLSYDRSVVIGLYRENKALLNPAGDTIIEKSDTIITISEDDDLVNYTGLKEVKNDELIVEAKNNARHHEKIMILGWNHRAKIIIRELASYSEAVSRITVVADEKNVKRFVEEFNAECTRAQIDLIKANTSDKASLEKLDLDNYDHLIILSYQDRLDVQQADAKTLITLLHLRNIAETKGFDLNIVTEMLDAKNRELANVTKADDFIISDNMISLLLSQVSENKSLMKIFEQLFKSEGNEVYLKPASQYIKTGVDVDFYTIVESAARKHEVAIGYRLIEDYDNDEKNFGIVLNPVKSKAVHYGDEDFIIVIAEN